MLEMPQQIYFITAIAVVCLGLTILVFFMREGFVTSKVYQQGIKFYQNKDYQSAETAFRDVISRHPSNDMVRLLLGETLMQQGKLEEAIAQFQELLNRAPKNTDAYLRLGSALAKQDKLAEAIAMIEKARDLLKAQRHTQKAEEIEQLLAQISSQQGLT